MSPRPTIFVLAGVNGAGKSSLLSLALEDLAPDGEGEPWFNPDTFTRELQAESGLSLDEANAQAWEEGRRRLEAAIEGGLRYAFETTLGGNTITSLLVRAAASHQVRILFAGLDSVERHLERVRQRVMAGGHDIPEAKIRERYVLAPSNLIKLMPHLASLQVYDNSLSVPMGEVLPDPVLVLSMEDGELRYPGRTEDLLRTPDWAKPLVEAALGLTGNG